MHSPLEKKFNEYLGNIHKLLREDVCYLEDPGFINQLLDKMELINRNFLLLSAEKEDVFVYQRYLEHISNSADEALNWVENYPLPGNQPTFPSLKENLFLLNDLFLTSKKLINSFYPVH